MPFRIIERVLLTPETLSSFAIGLLVSVVICLEHPPTEMDPNATNRLFLFLIAGVVLIAALLGVFRVWVDNSRARNVLPEYPGMVHSIRH